MHREKVEPETDWEVKIHEEIDELSINPRQKGRLKNDLKLSRTIKDILDRVAIESSTLADVEDDAFALGVISKADLNRFYNVYINGALKSLETLQKFNDVMLNKVAKKKHIIAPADYLKYFLDFKKLENEHVKLVNEMRKSQDFTLEQPEREILIIYRSLTPELKSYFHKVIWEFVKQCPEIQRAIVQTNQQMMEENPEVRKEILKQREDLKNQ